MISERANSEWLVLSGESAIEEMKAQMGDAGLEPPCVPSFFRGSFRSNVDGWAWSSTDRIPSYFVYSFDIFPEMFSFEQAWATAFEDYFVVGHRGHGFNSYGFGLHLRLGSIAVSMQHAWGGAYGDAATDAAKVNDSHRHLNSLLEALPSGFEAAPLEWAVGFSDFREYGAVLARSRKPLRLRGLPGFVVEGWEPVIAGFTSDSTGRGESDPTFKALGNFLSKLKGGSDRGNR